MNTRPETFMPLIHCIIDDLVPSHARHSVRRCYSASKSWTYWISQRFPCMHPCQRTF